jgi:type IV pilus biogenesis protein PilP
MAAKPVTLALVLVAVFVANPAAAVPGEGDSNEPITASDLANLQARIVYAKAQAQLAELQRKSSAVVSGAVDLAEQATGSALPVVSGVYGRDRDLYASFIYSNGMDWQAKAGMTAPGGYTVTSITQDRVVLTRGGRSYVLGFSSMAPVEPEKSDGQQSRPAGTTGSPFLPLPAGK